MLAEEKSAQARSKPCTAEHELLLKANILPIMTGVGRILNRQLQSYP